MPIVVIDTNLLIQNYLLDSAHIRKLLIGCRRLGISLYIPALVEDELRGNHKQDIRKSFEVVGAEIKQLRKRGITIELPELDEAKELAKYGKLIAAVKKKFGVKTAAYPKISLSKLISEAYERKKPFKLTGEGHKDYLIFATILELIGETKQDVFFLTNNTSDFCNSKGDLHPDLVSSVPAGRKVTTFSSLQNFYTAVLDAQLQELGSLDDPGGILNALKNGTFPGFDLNDTLENILIEELIEKSTTLDDIGGPLDEPSPATLLDFDVDEDELKVSKLDEGLLNIDVCGHVELELFGFISKNDYYHNHESEIEGVTVDDPDWNDWVISAYWTTKLSFDLSVVFNDTSHEIESVSVEVSRLD